MIIPAVGAGIIVFLVDFAIGVVIVAALLSIVGFTYWMLSNIRNAAAALPVIGGPAAGFVTNARDVTVSIARAYEQQITNNFFWLIRNLRFVLNFFLAPLFIPIGNTLQAHFNWLNFISNVWIPQAWDLIQANTTAIAAHFNWLNFLSNVQLPAVWAAIAEMGQMLVAHANWLNFISNVHIPEVWRGIDAIRADLALAMLGIRELQEFLPLLRALARFETEAVGGIDRLAGRIGELERGEADLVREVAKVAPLSIVTALGIAAVMNLERLARDPCHCLTAGDFSDLPSRVDALESIGP